MTVPVLTHKPIIEYPVSADSFHKYYITYEFGLEVDNLSIRGYDAVDKNLKELQINRDFVFYEKDASDVLGRPYILLTRPAAWTVIVIKRSTQVFQPETYDSQTLFAPITERSLDRLTMIIQDIDWDEPDYLDRTVHLSDTEELLDEGALELPVVEVRKNKLAAFDDIGNVDVIGIGEGLKLKNGELSADEIDIPKYGAGDGILITPKSDDFTPEQSGVAESLKGVAFGEGYTCAVGDGGVILISKDLQQWQLVSIPGLTSNLHRVIHEDRKFIAVGDGGKVVVGDMISEEWSIKVIDSAVDLNSITFGGVGGLLIYVVVGNGGRIYYSYDLINWASANSHVSENLLGIIYRNGLFIAFGKGTTVHSPDIVNWTESKIRGEVYFTNQLVIHQNDVYFALVNKEIQYSYNLLYWKPVESAIGYVFNVLKLVDVGFVACGSNGSHYYISRSQDGFQWQHELVDYNFFQIIGDSGTYILTENVDYYTHDFVNFTKFSIATTSSIDKVQFAKGNGIFVGVYITYPNNLHVCYSYNAEDWYETTLPGPHELDDDMSLTFTNGVFMLLFSGADYSSGVPVYKTVMKYSHDGISWYDGLVLDNTVCEFFWSTDNFLIFRESRSRKKYYFTSDGVNYEIKNPELPADITFRLYAHEAGLFYGFNVADPQSSDRHVIYTSTDFIDWTNRVDTITGMAADRDDILAVSREGRLFKSTEGIGWENIFQQNISNANAVERGVDRYIVVCDGGRIEESKTGELWENVNSKTTENIYDVDAYDDRVIAVCGAGVVLTSSDIDTINASVDGVTIGINDRKEITYLGVPRRMYQVIISKNGWEHHDGHYSQHIDVSGIKATDTPLVDVVLSDDVDVAKDQILDWGLVDRMTTAEGLLTVYSYNSAHPSMDLSVQLLVI